MSRPTAATSDRQPSKATSPNSDEEGLEATRQQKDHLRQEVEAMEAKAAKEIAAKKKALGQLQLKELEFSRNEADEAYKDAVTAYRYGEREASSIEAKMRTELIAKIEAMRKERLGPLQAEVTRTGRISEAARAAKRQAEKDQELRALAAERKAARGQ